MLPSLNASCKVLHGISIKCGSGISYASRHYNFVVSAYLGTPRLSVRQFCVLCNIMSAVTRLPRLIALFSTVSAALGIVVILLSRRTSTAGATSAAFNFSKMVWALVAAVSSLMAVANFKNLPFMWHFRVLRGMFYQLKIQRQTTPPKHLFAPLITSSYNTVYDTDYNFHKSNSTYFADLDVARAQHVSCVIRTGLARLNQGDEEGLSKSTIETAGGYNVALGAVSCFFKKDRKSTRLNSSHSGESRMPSSA